MGRWAAPSSDDYYDPGRRSGIERTCQQCQGVVMVDRDELYQVSVWCDQCRADAAPLRVECCWCTPRHVIREGAEPTSSGMCAKAKLIALAEADRKHHPIKTGTR